MARKWTKREENQLLQGVGVFGIGWFRRNTQSAYDWPGAPRGRTRAALYAKARRLYGRGGFSKGSFSLRKASKVTGYSITQIKRAMEALKQKWKRTSATGSYLIFEEQLEEITQWLRKDFWSKKQRAYCCLWCQRESVGHHGRGLCFRCYQRYYQRLRRLGLPLETDQLVEKIEVLRESGIIEEASVATALRSLERGHALPEIFLARLARAWRRYGNTLNAAGTNAHDSCAEHRESVG